MLSDRPYLRDDDYPRERTSVLTWLLSGLVAGFVLQLAIRSWAVMPATESFAALSKSALEHGRVWTLLTYSFLHSADFLPHLVVSLLALYLLGRQVLPVLESRRFLGVYFTAVVAGGLAWAGLHWAGGTAEPLVGPTAGISALLVVFACFYPSKRIEFLLLFVLPVRVTAKQIAFAALAFDAIGVLLEIKGRWTPYELASPFAHSAHLAGMLVGWIYFRYFHETRLQAASRIPEVEMVAAVANKPRDASPAIQVNLAKRSDLRAEVDRILDKINSQGLGALSPEEKRLLDEAKDAITRR